MTTYPTREAASWPPAEGFTKIDAGNNYRGIPDGYHTGGAYLSPDGKEVWKPLVGLWPTMDGFVADKTNEVECLQAGAGLKSFPANWRVEQAADKPWLVRPRAIVIKNADDVRHNLDIHDILQIEQDIRALNQRGWAVHDDLSIARWLNQRFVLDLSAAGTCKIGWDDDKDHVIRWLKGCVNIPWLAYIREEGRFLMDPFKSRWNGRWENDIAAFLQEMRDYRHIYVSRSRPMDAMWAPRDWYYLPGTDKDMSEARVHTWVITKEPIPPEKIYSYEMNWAWSPWEVSLT